MFRNGLLLSTAMTAAALLLSGANAAQAQTGMHVAGRDANARFVCTYGGFSVYFDAGGGSSYTLSAWQHVAVPITGHGETVRSIRVIQYTGFSSGFTAGIYSNTPSGFPGKLIAGGRTGRAGLGCGPVKISVRPTKLKRHTTYWIEETIPFRYNVSSSSTYWIANPNTKRKAYVQSHQYTFCSSQAHSCHSSSYTSPWTKQTMGPYFELR